MSSAVDHKKVKIQEIICGCLRSNTEAIAIDTIASFIIEQDSKLEDEIKWKTAQIENMKQKIEELEFNMSEHKRLHSELNDILHPNGDKPENPSLCDLVAYVRKDLKKPKLSDYTIDELVMEIEDRGQEIGFM